MDGYLVVGRGMADDIPMQLCRTRGEALEFAETLTDADVRVEANDLFNVGVSEVISVVVVEFRDGAPVRTCHAKDGERPPLRGDYRVGVERGRVATTALDTIGCESGIIKAADVLRPIPAQRENYAS